PLRRALPRARRWRRGGRGRHACTAFLRPGDGSRHLRGSIDERSRIVRNRWIRGAVITALAAAVAVVAAGWSGHQNGVAGTFKPTASNANIKGSITFDGVWTSSSGQKQFQDVINAFNKKYPNVKVNYHPIGDSLP